MPPDAPAPATFTAVILAGDRGPSDPICRATGAAHKCLAEVAGTTMLERVATALMDSPGIGRIAVVLKDPGVLDQLEGLAPMVQEGRLSAFPAAGSPSRSVLAALASLEDSYPVLVTTADHALLNRKMVDHFCRESAAADADVTAGVTASRVLLSRYPRSRRTYLKFRDERYSGSNLFAFMTPAGKAAAEIWLRAEQQRKRPWRVAAVFGPVLLVSYLLRLLSLDAAMERISKRLGIKVAAVKMPFAEAAIDVDKPEDLQLVAEILGGAG